MTTSEEAVPQVSVVIPTRNRPAALRACLEAILAGELQAFEILVMDQSDDDETKAIAAKFADDRIAYDRMPRPGACPARNLGAALAAANIVAFTDDDCCPASNWLATIREIFDEDPELQFVFGQLKAPPDNGAAGWYPEFLPSEEWQRRQGPRRVAMVAAGANMSARKSFLLRIGGFDELLGPSKPTVKSNDASISYKVLRSGAKWKATPAVEVIHTNGLRNYKDLSRLVREYGHGLGVNYGRFARRGDMYALWCFATEQRDMALGALKGLIRHGRPTGAAPMLRQWSGLWSGLTFSPTVGYVTGETLRRMTETRELY
jgi:glycosyltransferase involved in cell wall biosynthesis